jgi:hypothetical protein
VVGVLEAEGEAVWTWRWETVEGVDRTVMVTLFDVSGLLDGLCINRTLQGYAVKAGIVDAYAESSGHIRLKNNDATFEQILTLSIWPNMHTHFISIFLLLTPELCKQPRSVDKCHTHSPCDYHTASTSPACKGNMLINRYARSETGPIHTHASSSFKTENPETPGYTKNRHEP